MSLLFKAFIVVIFAFLVRHLLRDWLLLRSIEISENNIKDKNVFITGASAGIGRSTALIYCKLGANLIITARSENKLKEVQKECKELGNANVNFVIGDMNKTEDVDSVAKFVLQHFKQGMDHMILNHVAPYNFRYFNGDMDFVRLHAQVTFVSYVHLTTRLLPLLSKYSGSLVAISSLSGKLPTPFFSPYSGAKFALDGFYRSLYHTFRAHGSNVSIGIVTLGYVDSEAAVSALSEMMKDWPPKSSYEAAEVITKTAVSKASDVSFPIINRSIILIYKWFEKPLLSLMKAAFPSTVMEKTWPKTLYGEI